MAGTTQSFKHARSLALVAALLAFGACDSGGAWVPLPGPYSGTFAVGDQVMGSLTLTANASAVTGTGSLTHNEQPVAVAIAASINGRSFTGFVSNASLGSGEFNGAFQGDLLQGTFSYIDAGGVSTTTGTWTALREE